MNELKNLAFKLQDWVMSLYVLVSFIMVGVSLASIIYYQFINYRPLVVITSCVTLFLMIYTNKEVRG